MWRSDDPYLLWLLVTLMLSVAWVMMPLSAVYGYVEEQHCLLTWGRSENTAVVNIITADIESVPRFGNRYHVQLMSPIDTSPYFQFGYDGYDGTFDESLYDMPLLVPQLQALQTQNQPIEVVWVNAPLFRGDEDLMTHIGGEPVPASCEWWWGPGYALLLLFFVGLTWLVITAVQEAVRQVNQNPDITQEEMRARVIKDWWQRWEKWRK